MGHGLAKGSPNRDATYPSTDPAGRRQTGRRREQWRRQEENQRTLTRGSRFIPRLGFHLRTVLWGTQQPCCKQTFFVIVLFLALPKLVLNIQTKYVKGTDLRQTCEFFFSGSFGFLFLFFVFFLDFWRGGSLLFFLFYFFFEGGKAYYDIKTVYN